MVTLQLRRGLPAVSILPALLLLLQLLQLLCLLATTCTPLYNTTSFLLLHKVGPSKQPLTFSHTAVVFRIDIHNLQYIYTFLCTLNILPMYTRCICNVFRVSCCPGELYIYTVLYVTAIWASSILLELFILSILP